MPNIKSQIKRDRTNAEAHASNAAEKNRCRTAIKKVEALVKEGKKAEAEAALKEAMSILDSHARAGVMTKNSADRKKAHLQAAVASLN